MTAATMPPKEAPFPQAGDRWFLSVRGPAAGGRAGFARVYADPVEGTDRCDAGELPAAGDGIVGELDVVLASVAQVQQAPIDGVEPMSHPMPIVNVTRPDVVRPSLTPEQALAMAPASEVGRFAAPRILTED